MATTEIRVPATKDAPALARRAVDALDVDLDPKQLGEVRLIVSELVANVVKHGGKVPEETVKVEVTVVPDIVRGSICDIGAWLPDPAFVEEPQEDRPEAFGLFLVDQLSTRWGIRRETPACVWFELDC
jgi:anti-sigma regulatory factor (Ser/Thr protein kinase)